jgi:glutamyl-tRNA synthetase
VKGHISFSNSELDDFILERSDKVPTYNFAVVVDDVTMGINTVIRGDDHVNNTPRQILLYRALGNPLPVFGHVPMVLGPDGARLSKRHGAMSVTAYRDMGYLPDAMINFLVRLGWSYGDQEFFTREELIEKFDLEHIGRSAGIFNIQKLVSLNADHIKESRPEKTAGHLAPFMEERGIDPFEYGEDYFHRVIATLNTRSKTLAEMADGALFYYKKDIEYDKKAANKFLKPDISDALQKLKEKIADLDEFTEKKLEGVFGEVMTETGLKLGKIAQPVRVALTGTTVSPGIFEIVEVLGKDEVVNRLDRAIRFMETKEE